MLVAMLAQEHIFALKWTFAGTVKQESWRAVYDSARLFVRSELGEADAHKQALEDQ